MKKIALAIIIAATAALSVAAQPRTLGIRSTYGAEVSFQFDPYSILGGLSGEGFVEADLGWFNHGVYLTGVYDWLLGSEDRFNFYAGAGGTLGYYDHNDDAGLNLGVVGQVGVEYNFDLPLTFSLDWRPVWNFMYGGFYPGGLGFAVRYRF